MTDVVTDYAQLFAAVLPAEPQTAQVLALLSIVQLFVWQIVLHYHPNYFQTSLFARLTYWFSILTAVMSTIVLTVGPR